MILNQASPHEGIGWAASDFLARTVCGIVVAHEVVHVNSLFRRVEHTLESSNDGPIVRQRVRVPIDRVQQGLKVSQLDEHLFRAIRGPDALGGHGHDKPPPDNSVSRHHRESAPDSGALAHAGKNLTTSTEERKASASARRPTALLMRTMVPTSASEIHPPINVSIPG